MPIKGTISARLYHNRIETMKVGQVAYMNAGDIIITANVVFIDLITQIVLPQHFFEDEENKELVLITRTGPGLTEHDFEIDITILDDFEYYIEDRSTYNSCMKEKSKYVIFKNFELERLISSNRHTETLEELQESLLLAEQAQDYEKAERINKKIDELKRQQ